MVKQFFQTSSLQQINSYFTNHYNLDTLNIVAKIPHKQKANISNKKIEEVIKKSLNKKVEPFAFKYTEKELFDKKLKGGKFTEVVKGKHIPIHSMQLENTILINHYYSDIKKEKVLVTVTIPTGQFK